MARPGMLAILALALGFVPSAGHAQFGGTGGGQNGFGGMGGRFTRQSEEQRTVEIEVIGGDRLSGPLRLGPIVIECTLGRYAIKPGKIQMIRFDPDAEAIPDQQGLVNISGTIATTTEEEIAGVIAIPNDWSIATDLGTLTLDPAKLRSITFLPDPDVADSDRPDAGAESPVSITARIGKYFWIATPSGDQVALNDSETGETKSLRLTATDGAPLRVSPIYSAGLLALNLEGAAITRLAVFSFVDGAWHTQELPEPVSGSVSPTASVSVAAYNVGRYVYAFSSQANRWDILELPEGSAVTPAVSADAVNVNADDQYHTFSAATGAWTHIDLRGVLEAEAPDARPASPEVED